MNGLAERRWGYAPRFGDVVLRAGAVILVGCSVLLLVAMFSGGTRNHAFQLDFKGDLYDAGRAIVNGKNPYRPGLLEAQAAAVRAGLPIAGGASPRWPPPVLLAGVPLSLLPFNVAGWMFMLLSASAIILGLLLLGVRDWRCIALASLSWPALLVCGWVT